MIVSPTLATNALGRALTLADAASSFAETRVVAKTRSDPTWPGRERWPNVRVDPLRRFSDVVDAAGAADLVWTVKPLRGSLSLGLRAAGRVGRPVVADVDDDEVAFAQEFAGGSPVQRLWLTVHRESPERLRRTRRLLARADAATYATRCVLARADHDAGLRAAGRPLLRVPHVRRSFPNPGPDTRDQEGPIRVGFLGTVRAHKGVDTLRMVAGLPDVELHLLARGLSGRLRPRFKDSAVVLRSDGAEDALADVDVVILPQQLTPGADVQLPAKYVDALAAAKPVVATRTCALDEFLAPGVVAVDDWSDERSVAAALRHGYAERARLGPENKAYFERHLDVGAVAPQLERFFHDVMASSRERTATDA